MNEQHEASLIPKSDVPARHREKLEHTASQSHFPWRIPTPSWLEPRWVSKFLLSPTWGGCLILGTPSPSSPPNPPPLPHGAERIQSQDSEDRSPEFQVRMLSHSMVGNPQCSQNSTLRWTECGLPSQPDQDLNAGSALWEPWTKHSICLSPSPSIRKTTSYQIELMRSWSE